MSKLAEIIAGWKNFACPNPETEKIAIMRMETCLECKELTKRKICGLCGCYMPAKVRSKKSKCVIDKW